MKSKPRNLQFTIACAFGVAIAEVILALLSETPSVRAVVTRAGLGFAMGVWIGISIWFLRRQCRSKERDAIAQRVKENPISNKTLEVTRD